MKTILTLLFTLSCFSAQALDGEYSCGANQKVNYKSLANRLLKVSHQIDKISELKNSGEKDLALTQIESALRDISHFRRSLRSSQFCYSLTDKVEYLKKRSLNFELKLSLEQRALKERNSCEFFIEQIKKDIYNHRTIASKPHIQYIAFSKTLRKTNQIFSRRDCSKEQKSELSSLFEDQSTFLDSLYQKVKSK